MQEMEPCPSTLLLLNLVHAGFNQKNKKKSRLNWWWFCLQITHFHELFSNYVLFLFWILSFLLLHLICLFTKAFVVVFRRMNMRKVGISYFLIWIIAKKKKKFIKYQTNSNMILPHPSLCLWILCLIILSMLFLTLLPKKTNAKTSADVTETLPHWKK